MAYKIVKAHLGDESRFARIQIDSWKAAYSDILSEDCISRYLDLEHVISIYHNILENGRGNGLIMQVDGEDHCISYWDKARSFEDDEMAELICIHSLQNRWRNGFGSIMMQEVFKEVKNAGYSKICLWVFEENIRARRFYEANGFIKTDKSQQALGTIEVCYMKTLM